MKFVLKTLALSSLVALSAASSHADDSNLGFHIGPNFSRATIENKTTSAENISTRTGLAVGVLFNAPVSSYFSLQPELNYVERGFRYDPDPDTTVSASFNLEYLEAPALLKADLLGHDAPVRPAVFTGPMIGFLTGKSISIQNRSSSLELSGQDVDIYNNVVLSAVFGTSVDFTVQERFSLGLDFRYNLGLTNVVDQGKGGNSDVTMKNQSFQLMAEVLYRL